MTDDDRIPGARLQRFAERTFDRTTLENVMLPALADLQHECRTARGSTFSQRLVRLRAYWGLWKTIVVCAVGDVVHNRNGIASSLGTRTVVFLAIVVTVLAAPSVSWMVSFGSKYGAGTALTAGALMLPANILVALPAAFFFALAMSRGGVDIPYTRLLPTAAAGTLACAVVVFALMMFVAPTTNQEFRTRVFTAFQADRTDGPRIPLRKGLTEMTWPELNAHIRQAPSSRQAELALAHRQGRFAFVATVFVLGLLGLALAGRWRSKLATFGVALAVLVLYGVCFGFGTGLNKYGYPAAYGTWTANGAFLVIGVRLLRSRRKTLPMLNAEC